MTDWRDLVEPTLKELESRTYPDYVPTGDDPHPPMDPDDLTWLRRNVDLEAPDLYELKTVEEVAERFPTTSKHKHPPINDSRLLTTSVWQIWLKLRSGQLEPIEGNVRSLWYQYIEGYYRSRKLLSTHSYGRSGDGPADRIIAVLHERVLNFVYRRVFRYRDEFSFQPPLNYRGLVGNQGKPGILFYTEKEGLWGMCEDLHGKPGEPLLAGKQISVMASKGEPSYISLEFFAQELRKRQVQRLRIGCLCDYDPWGYCIAQSMDEKMRHLGFDVTTWTLATPDLFTPEEIAANGHDFSELLAEPPPPPDAKDVKSSLRTLVKHWFELTGGINGAPVSMHVDTANKKRRTARTSWFFKRLIADKEIPGIPTIKPGEFETLQKELQQLLKSDLIPFHAINGDTYGDFWDTPQALNEMVELDTD